MSKLILALINYHNHFTALFWDTRVSRCQKKDYSGLYSARQDNTYNPGRCYSIQTNQQSTSINAPTFMPDDIPAATLPIYPGLGQAQEYAGLHTPRLGLALIKLYCKILVEHAH